MTEAYTVSRWILTHATKGVYIGTWNGLPKFGVNHIGYPPEPELTVFNSLEEALTVHEGLEESASVRAIEVFCKPSEAPDNGICYMSAARAQAVVTLREIYDDLMRGNILIEDVWLELWNIKRFCEEKGHK